MTFSKQLDRLRVFNKLKSVHRASRVGTRPESSAEHTWSALILADYFLTTTPHNLCRERTMDLLLYHDVVEILANDTPLHPHNKHEPQAQALKEQQAAQQLCQQLPTPVNNKFLELFNEYEAQQTLESKYAKAIDALDIIIHQLDYKEEWKGWTREFIEHHKAHLYTPFPDLQEAFNQLLDYTEEQGYL